MSIVLYSNDAPKAVEHFKALVAAGRYNNQRIYRVVADRYIQCGIGYDEARSEMSVSRDSGGQHRHVRGAIGFAREDLGDPDSGTTEIYICRTDQFALDRLGFVPFGQMIEGFSVLDEIAEVPVRQRWLYWDGVSLRAEFKSDSLPVPWHEPLETIVMSSITIKQRPRKPK